MKDAVLGTVRHLLTTGGGVLVASGYATTSEIEQAAGAVVVLAGFAWSLYDKWSRQR